MMPELKSFEIIETVNGWIVRPLTIDPRGDYKPHRMESVMVFNKFDDMAKWLRAEFCCPVSPDANPC